MQSMSLSIGNAEPAGAAPALFQLLSPCPYSGLGAGMGMRGGLPHQLNFRRRQGVGLVDEVAEGPLQGRGFGDEGAAGSARAGVFVAQGVRAGGRERLPLALSVFPFLVPFVQYCTA